MELLLRIKKHRKSQKGQLLIELVLAIGLAAVLLPAIFTSIIVSREGKVQQKLRLEAVGYMKEAEEAVRIVREAGWSYVATNGIYHPAINGSTWSLASGSQLVDTKFTRQINIQDAYRNIDGILVNNPTPSDIIDPSTKKVDISISWNTPYPSSMTNTIYLTRHENVSFMHTTRADFESGITTDTIISLTAGSEIPDDGEVLLGSGGGRDWCSPFDSIVAFLDLPKSGVANAISAQEGRIFAGTGENRSGVSFADVLATSDNPPVLSIGGEVSGYKTNDVFGEEEEYVYIATDFNHKEVVTISTDTYAEIGYFNPAGNNSGAGIFVSGTVGYVTTTANKLHTFNLTSKTGEHSQLGEINLAGTGTSIVVVGNYAYISISGSSTKLQIVDVSNPSNLTIVGQAVFTAGNAQDVYTNSLGTRAYIATAQSATSPEFFIIDVSNKTGNRSVIASYDTADMNPKALTVVPGNRAIIVGHEGEQYQVIDISNETTPSRCGGLTLVNDINNVDSVLTQSGTAYSFILTTHASMELQVIEGGPGGQYSNSGSFESGPFDALTQSTFNFINASVIQPAGTSITMQVAVANAINENCNDSSYLFIGPDGTSSSYFTSTGGSIRGTIPYISTGNYINPGRCFKYKTFFESADSFYSPILGSALINYSP